MKIFKKTSWALFLLAVFGVCFALWPQHKAVAANCGYSACSQKDITSVNDWKLTAQDAITATFNGQPITFTDHRPLDGDHRYDAPPGKFCSGGGGVGSVKIDDWSQVESGQDPVDATVDIDYWDASVGTTTKDHCVNWGNTPANGGVSDPGFTIVDKNSWLWNGAKIASGDGKTTLSVVNSDNLLYGVNNTDTCNGGVVILLDAPQSSTGTLYYLHPVGLSVPGTKASADSGIGSYYKSGKCIITYGPTQISIIGNYSSNGGPSTSCVYHSDGYWTCNQVFPGGTTTPSGGGSTPQTCETNFKHSFTWIMCPAMSLADDAAGQFNDFIDEQLCFKTTAGAADKNNVSTTNQTSSTGSSVICQGNNNLTASVKQAWSIFKNIASVLIVIALLVMVISQAFGGGIFDAYTIRKLLPKLVAAVIIMQLSWYFLKWAIDITNDVGSAIESLIMAPFGGVQHLTLKSLVGYDLSVQGGTTSAAAAGTVFFAALAASVIVSVPTLFMMALYVVLALFTAFVVLLFRKLLIILLIILAPVALVLWVMPGTDRYWKMWRENFTKLLLMFPMITGMIAAGRVFAYIASGNGAASGSLFHAHLAIAHLGPLPVPVFGTFTNFIDLVIIIGAWFAPYFLLPQTYKWGGTALGQIANGVNKAVEKGSHPAKEYLKWRQGLSPWKQARDARKAEVTRRAKTRFYEGLGSGGLMGSARRARLGGVPMPTPGGLREEADIRRTIVESATDAQRKENYKVASARLAEHISGMTEAQRRTYVRTRISDRSLREEERHAALKQAMIDRDYATVESYMNDAATSGDPVRIAEANRFRQENASDFALVTHMLKGDIGPDGLHQGIMRAADGNEKEITSLHGVAVQSILSHLSYQAAHGSTPAVQAAAQARLNKFLTTYANATQNVDVRGDINSGGAAAVREFVDAAAAAAHTPHSFAGDRTSAATAYDPATPHIEIEPDLAVREHYVDPATSPVPVAISDLQAHILPGGIVV